MTGSSYSVGLPFKKCAKKPSEGKQTKKENGKNKNTLALRAALREAFEERASASDDLDKSLSYKNFYWSDFTDEDGNMLTSGDAICDKFFEWADTQGKHYTQKRKDKKTGEIKEYECYRALREDATFAFTGAVIMSADDMLRYYHEFGEVDSWVENSIGWMREHYTIKAYAIHYDEGYKDEDGKYRELEAIGLWHDGYVRKQHIQYFGYSVDSDGKYIGNEIADVGRMYDHHGSYYHYMNEHGVPVADNRNFNQENVEADIKNGLTEEQARAKEGQRANERRQQKQDKRTAYGVRIPRGCTRNQYSYLRKKQRANKQAQEILTSAKEQAQTQYRETVDRANLDADAIRQQANIDYKAKMQGIENRAAARLAAADKQAAEMLKDAQIDIDERYKKVNEAAAKNEAEKTDLHKAMVDFNADKDKWETEKIKERQKLIRWQKQKEAEFAQREARLKDREDLLSDGLTYRIEQGQAAEQEQQGGYWGEDGLYYDEDGRAHMVG